MWNKTNNDFSVAFNTENYPEVFPLLMIIMKNDVNYNRIRNYENQINMQQKQVFPCKISQGNSMWLSIFILLYARATVDFKNMPPDLRIVNLRNDKCSLELIMERISFSTCSARICAINTELHTSVHQLMILKHHLSKHMNLLKWCFNILYSLNLTMLYCRIITIFNAGIRS